MTWEDMPEWVQEDTQQFIWSNNIPSSAIAALQDLIMSVYKG